ncbi:hypothetical protein MTsPCn9_11100 [Croceitalea sp. MTPC9]|uniref:hypothetical protein n=1 Tax=unclassified Croceitalea TaxID=2632280 RepID=UPI002B3C3C96|nr:hypothetical protein MTsPCn6_26140 [Croceitalea sp. MTPC6]GMN16174.1 hypothetical protein MTsPCn9_11100 [Croceitalea sp. MTPC9]
MMKKFCALLLFLPIPLLMFGQESLAEQTAKKAFQEHFAVPRETLFLHLNKSNFITNEEIWFKAYIYNKKKRKPFKVTTNLYVGVYDNEGKQLTKKLYRASNGYSNGSIKLDSSIAGGDYYIKASTNWLQNFKEEGSYIQKISIYNQGSSQSSTTKESIDYDVHLLPEGGKLISGLQNRIGVKCIDKNGLSIEITGGIVKDSGGNKVASFKGSHLGMASFTLNPIYGENYFVTIYFRENKEGTYLLPKSTHDGHNISLIDENKGRLMLVFGRGKVSKEKNGKQKMILWVSKDGLAKKLNINFGKDSNYVSLVIDKKTLYEGMNTLTLLDPKGKPILERLYYNHNEQNKESIKIADTKIEKDSVTIFIARNTEIEGAPLSLSVSVLPQETVSYQHKDNILSTFLLRPYLKGLIENPSYYFKDVTLKKKKELDLLLLTQGWSTYDWDEIYSTPPKNDFSLNQGIEVFGTIQSKIQKGQKLMIYPFEGFQGSMIQLRPDETKFSISGLFPKKGQEIKFSLINKNGNIIKPKMFVSTRNEMTTERLKKTWKIAPIENSKTREEILLLEDFITSDKTIKLEGVTLTKERKEERFFAPFIFKHKLTKVTKKIENSYPNMLEIIRNNGFLVYISYEPGDQKVRINSRRQTSFRGAPSPIIYIDDVRLVDFDKLLYFYPLSDVDSYYISRSGDMESGGGGGVIRIYLKDISERKDTSARLSADEKIFKFIVKEGYESIKRFYNPKYQNYGESFEKFGTIHWEPNIVLNGKKVTAFKILNTGTQKISLFVEGMSLNGKLISTIKHVNLKENSKPHSK